MLKHDSRTPFVPLFCFCVITSFAPLVGLSESGDSVTEKDNRPRAIIYLDEDCSLYSRDHKSLSVTVFTARKSKAFPEFDLPSPVKVARKLMLLRPRLKNAQPEQLLDAGTGAMGSPSVSYDGKDIYLSMAKQDDGFYHIYRLSVETRKLEQLTDGPFHDIDPTELPDGRIAFCSTRIGRFEEYHSSPSRSVFTMDAKGKNIRPLTHTFIFDNEPEVMTDGRIILLRSDNFFDRGKVETMLHAIRPDGTGGTTLFGLENGPEYGVRLRSYYCGSPAPMPDGRVAFVTNKGITIGTPGQPPKQHQHISIHASGVSALPDGRLLSAIKNPKEDNYRRIAILDPSDKTPKPVTLYESKASFIHSPMYLGPRKRPPIMDTRVDDTKADNDTQDTGFLFCSNIRFTSNTSAGWPHVRAVRVLASKGLTLRSSHSYIVHAGSEVTELGTVPVAPDGSFSIEVPADTGIALQAVDAEGRSELNEMSWITVRPGERRGCLGCHENRNAAPVFRNAPLQAMSASPAKLLGSKQSHVFRGNNPAVTGLMELQFDRFREVAGINRLARDDKKDEVAALIAYLNTAPPELKTATAQRLGILREPEAAPALLKCLTDPQRDLRLAAAVAVAACGTRDSIPLLLEALSDPDPLVAQAASMALENITGHSIEFNPFTSPANRVEQTKKWTHWFAHTDFDKMEGALVATLGSSDKDAVRRAAVAMRHIGREPSRQALSALLLRERINNPYPEWVKSHKGDRARFNALSNANPRTLQAVTRSLGAFNDTATTTLLADTLAMHLSPKTGNLFLAEAAAEALGKIGTQEAETHLIAAFSKLGPYHAYSRWYGDHEALIACHASPVHHFILEGLNRMDSTRCASLTDRIIESVPTDPDRALLLYNDDYERLAGRLIRLSGHEADVVNACLSILGDHESPTDSARSEEIKQALGKVHEAWAGRPNIDIRAAQILSLVCRDVSYEPQIRAALERYIATTTQLPRVFNSAAQHTPLPTRNWTCFYLARSLGNLKQEASVDLLVSALKGPSEGAAGVPDPTGPGVLFLHNELTPCWRAACAWALGETGTKNAIPTLLATIKELSNAPDTRHTAAEALRKLADKSTVNDLQGLADNYPEVSTRQTLLSILAELKTR